MHNAYRSGASLKRKDIYDHLGFRTNHTLPSPNYQGDILVCDLFYVLNIIIKRKKKLGLGLSKFPIAIVVNLFL